MRLGRGFTVAGAITLAGLACRDATGPAVTLDVRGWVTGAAALALDAKGHYVFPTARIGASDTSISESQAISLARAFVVTFDSSPAFVSQVNTLHGGPVDLAHVTLSSRVEFAETSYESIPVGLDDPDRRFIAPAYLVRFFDGATAGLTVSVSAFTTEIVVDSSGRLVYPRYPVISGNDFQLLASPLADGPGWGLPLGPEDATRAVATATGARVAELPALFRPDENYSNQFARWKMTLDQTVTVRGATSGTIFTTRQLYVGATLRAAVEGPNPAVLYVPLAVQPQVDTRFSSGPVNVKSGFPVAFEEVTVVR